MVEEFKNWQNGYCAPELFCGNLSMKRIGDIIQCLTQFLSRLWLQITVSRHLDREIKTYLDCVLCLNLNNTA
jgi:hypothetical protein